MSAEFKDRLIEAMKKRNIIAVELADMTMISKARISQYMNGVYTPKSKATYRIAEALDVRPAWLMGYDVPMDEDDDEPSSTLPADLFPDLSTDERELIGDYRELNDDGKRLVRDYTAERTRLPEYKKGDKADKVG